MIFIYTQQNQRRIDVLQSTAYVSYWLVPERFVATVQSGIFQCSNYGNDYTHYRTSYFVTVDLQVYLGKFSFFVYADNGWRFLEGETTGYSGVDVALKAAYAHKTWQLLLTWRLPLVRGYKE